MARGADRAAARLLLAAAACSALVAAPAGGRTVYKTQFDTSPNQDKELEPDRSVEKRTFQQTEVTQCPGSRRNMGDLYRNCLFLGLDWCENKNAPAKGGCYRNEYRLKGAPKTFDNGKEYWLGTSIFMTDNYKYDVLKTIHLQIKARGGAAFSPRAPSFILLDQYGYWAVVLRGSDQCNTACYIKSGFVQYLTPVRRNRWADFVFHIKFSYTPGDLGFIRVFLDGHIVFERYELYAGYNDPFDFGLYFKWGLYKHQWGEGKSSGNPENHLTTRTEAYHSAYHLLESSDPATFHEADTRPGAGCSSIEECCSLCAPEGGDSAMFNEYRCAQHCDSAKGASHPLCQREMTPCTNVHVGECCAKCVNGLPNPMYSHDRCFKSCRGWEVRGLSADPLFDEYCFETAYDGCNTGAPIQCDISTNAICRQEPYSTGCVCPAGFHINNKLGNACQTSEGFDDGRTPEANIKRRARTSRRMTTEASRRRRRRDSGSDDSRRRRRRTDDDRRSRRRRDAEPARRRRRDSDTRRRRRR